MKIINSHYDFDYIDLELKSGKDKIYVNLYNTDNLHPSWLIENQSESIFKQIDTFYKNQRDRIKKEVEILVNIIKDGKPSYMIGLLRMQ